ncbi:unnamed protein product [Polarella glacialis]|uniref:Uncharacterized protein n=1 Tax=Polarella glacialis TaxID=89957 RepID=A0A813HUH3_POLGL|nr:unnamed protein product [Polarella glacialis]
MGAALDIIAVGLDSSHDEIELEKQAAQKKGLDSGDSTLWSKESCRKGQADSEATSADSPAAWSAVLWKQSQILGVWRPRAMRLNKAEDGWLLTSWELTTNRCTGSWKLPYSMPYIELAPKHGFAAAIVVAGVPLGASTRRGTAALNELCVLLNGAFMRFGSSTSLYSLGGGQFLDEEDGDSDTLERSRCRSNSVCSTAASSNACSSASLC